MIGVPCRILHYCDSIIGGKPHIVISINGYIPNDVITDRLMEGIIHQRMLLVSCHIIDVKSSICTRNQIIVSVQGQRLENTPG